MVFSDALAFYMYEYCQQSFICCHSGTAVLHRIRRCKNWTQDFCKLRPADYHCKGRWQHLKPKLNAHLHGSYFSNTKLKFNFYWIWRHQSKPGALYSFEPGGTNRKKVSKLIKNLLMPALDRHFQLMPAQRMGDHFFFCLYQLRLALI